MNIKWEYHIKRNIKIFSLLFFSFYLISCNKEWKKNKSSSIDFASIDFSKEINFSYAKEIEIKKADGYSLIKISKENPVLVIEEKSPVPSLIPNNITIIQKPLINTYLVSSSAMDFFVKLNILDKIKFTGTKKENIYLSEIVQAMENNKIIYAGKYNTPDYEILYSGKTDIAIQNTMIFHKPEVKEKLEQLQIPVIIEKSSYEKNPLARLEWIKLYGFLYDKEKEADIFFNEKLNNYLSLQNFNQNSINKKTISFFYFTSNGSINVRRPGDYIVHSIEMAGGKYFLDSSDFTETNSFSTMNMQSENFYIAAKDSDILIYNSTVDGIVNSKEFLLKKYPLLKDFKGFNNNKIYCTKKEFFQETTGIVDFIIDIKNILNDDEQELKYLVKIL